MSNAEVQSEKMESPKHPRLESPYLLWSFGFWVSFGIWILNFDISSSMAFTDVISGRRLDDYQSWGISTRCSLLPFHLTILKRSLLLNEK